jgi:uncharacterized protein
MNYLDVELEPDEPLALDRRTVDLDGRLHVTDCKISAARVNDYLGAEIPGGESLGLDPGKIYRMYRDRTALKAAAPTFENMPWLDDHVAVSATNPQKQRVIGAVSSVRYSHPYLVASLAVWDADAIARIRDGSKRQISCGYSYTADMTPGTIDGEAFDGRMLDIAANHVALVPLGRVGSDVLVADAAPRLARSMDEAIPGYSRLWRLR